MEQEPIDESGELIVASGPWGQAVDVLFCLAPLLFLLAATLWPTPLPTTTSLPMAAGFMFLVRTMYLGSSPLLCCGSIVLGVHEALTPLSIMAGAMLLFETMEATLCMPYMMRELKTLTRGHIVAELLLIFSFAYMVEGASGFGTPVALGAPMLVSLGHPKLESVITLLLFNTFATVWGAVGTPIWFGFGNLDFGDVAQEEAFLLVSQKSAIALGLSAFLLVPTTCLFLVPFRTLLQNWLFVVLALSSCVGPSLGMAFASYEFPSLLGGLIGCLLCSILIKFRVGLKPITKGPGNDATDPSPSGADPAEDVPAMNIGTVSPQHSIISESYARRQLSSMNSKVEGTDGSAFNRLASFASPEQVAATLGVAPSRVARAAGGTNGGTQELDPLAKADKGTESNDDDDDDASLTSFRSGNGDKDGAQSQNEETPRDVENQLGRAESSESTKEHENTGDDIRKAIEEALGPRKSFKEGYLRELLGRTFAIWGTVLVLIVTRVPQIGLKSLLTRRSPSFSIYFGTYGVFELSASLVLQLRSILTIETLNWKYELLYVPFLIPFVLLSLLTMLLYRQDLGRNNASCVSVVTVVLKRLQSPAVALIGALVLVQLMLQSGVEAPATIVGSILSQAMGKGFLAISALLGVLGSFFSGSTTISNLTFGNIQYIAAQTIGTSATSLLALQAVGASAGNGVCLNNIIAACTVVGLHVGEGQIIAQTYKVVVPLAILSTVIVLAFFIRFPEDGATI